MIFVCTLLPDIYFGFELPVFELYARLLCTDESIVKLVLSKLYNDIFVVLQNEKENV